MHPRKQSSVLWIRSVIVVFIFLDLTGLIDSSAGLHEWNYKEGDLEGPQNWYRIFPDCGGPNQSPIDIVTKDAVYAPHLNPLDLTDYKKTDGITMKIINVDGHTAEVLFLGKDVILKNGSLSTSYKLEQVHFHWGGDSSHGSEHSIDGQYFPMEIHFVHRQVNIPDFKVAMTKPFGLAVLSVLCEIGPRNENFDKIINSFYEIPNPNDEALIPVFPVIDLLPPTPFNYYRYYGSLTTPPCHESVVWSVAVPRVQLSEDQLKIFRSLFDEHKNPLINDFRLPQPLNDRIVLTTLDTNVGNSTAI